MVFIHNAKIVLETGILWDGAMILDGGRIQSVGNASELQKPECAEVVDAHGAYVGPGFVDIHTHGGGSAMFDTDPAGAAEHFLAHGETTILATLYYDLSRDAFMRSIGGVRQAMRESFAGKAIAGMYMEGPYMNPAYGASSEKNRWKGPICEEDYRLLVDCAEKDARVWAVAPEREGLAPFMEYARKVNPSVVFAVGHSEASPTEIRKLKRYGIRIQTHCMDATGRIETWRGTRGSGPDEACLADPDIYAELISDSQGIHVSADLQRLILRAKGVDRVILITDSFVSSAESPDDLRYITDLSFDANRDLCGSKLTLDVACRNIMHHTCCGITEAFLMASRNPACAIGMGDEIGTIEVGKRANLVFVDDMFHIKRVILNGETIAEEDKS